MVTVKSFTFWGSASVREFPVARVGRYYRYAARCYAAGRLPGYRVPALTGLAR
jgi:hypothetical protein